MSIIGNPLLLGGGGGSGATVRIFGARDENVSFSGPTSGIVLLNAAGEAYLPLPQKGVYTFTGGVSGYTASVNVQGDMDVLIRPAGAIYWYGVHISALTGGFVAVSGATLTDGPDSMRLLSTSTSGAIRYAASVNALDLSGYSALIAKGYTAASPSAPGNYSVAIGATQSSRLAYEAFPNRTSTPGTVTVDISGVSGRDSCYVQITTASGSNPTVVYAIWLE